VTEVIELKPGAAVVFRSDEDPVPRDRYGRPLIVPPEGGKPEAYMRATTLAKTLDDTYNLQQWAKRSVLIGAGARPDLAVSASMLAPKMATDRYAKKEIDKLADAAMEVSGSSTKRNMGTVLHGLSERVDRGESLDDVPENLKADLRAYWQATKDLEVLGIEEFVVNDPLKTAGTYDRTVRYRGRSYIFDLKTGNVTFAAGSIAIQLAVYATGVRYEHAVPVKSGPVYNETLPDGSVQPAQDYVAPGPTRSPLPEDLDPDWGIVAHLPQGEQRCELHWVDLKAGREAIERALWVRAYRKKRDLFTPFKEAV